MLAIEREFFRVPSYEAPVVDHKIKDRAIRVLPHDHHRVYEYITQVLDREEADEYKERLTRILNSSEHYAVATMYGQEGYAVGVTSFGAGIKINRDTLWITDFINISSRPGSISRTKKLIQGLAEVSGSKTVTLVCKETDEIEHVQRVFSGQQPIVFQEEEEEKYLFSSEVAKIK